MDAQPIEKVYIADTPVDSTDASLREIFQIYGNIVDLKVLPPRSPGTKGAALIVFDSVETAQWLVENVNGKVPEGMEEPVHVSYAKPPKSSKGKDGGKGDFKSGKGYDWYSPVQSSWNVVPSSPYGGGASRTFLEPESEKIFVGDIPADFDDDAVRQIFEQYGSVVEAKVLPPRTPGDKGAAKVTFATVMEAKYVVDNLNGEAPNGMSEPLFIKFAKVKVNAGAPLQVAPPVQVAPPARAPRIVGPPGASSGNGWQGSSGSGISIKDVTKGIYKSEILPGSGSKSDDNSVYVKNLPRDTTDLDLYKIFAPLGAIAVNGVKAMLGPDGFCKGSGFVDYVEPQSASLACLTLNGWEMPDGTRLEVEPRPPSKNKSAN